MAASKFTILDVAMLKYLNGKIALPTNTFKAALVESTEALTAAWTGTSLDGRYADLLHEITGGGYTAGGVTLTGVALTSALGVTKFDADNIVYPGLTNTFKYVVAYSDTAANKDILGFEDLNSSGNITSGGTDYEIRLSTDGLFTITRTP